MSFGPKRVVQPAKRVVQRGGRSDADRWNNKPVPSKSSKDANIQSKVDKTTVRQQSSVVNRCTESSHKVIPDQLRPIDSQCSTGDACVQAYSDLSASSVVEKITNLSIVSGGAAVNSSASTSKSGSTLSITDSLQESGPSLLDAEFESRSALRQRLADAKAEANFLREQQQIREEAHQIESQTTDVCSLAAQVEGVLTSVRLVADFVDRRKVQLDQLERLIQLATRAKHHLVAMNERVNQAQNRLSFDNVCIEEESKQATDVNADSLIEMLNAAGSQIESVSDEEVSRCYDKLHLAQTVVNLVQSADETRRAHADQIEETARQTVWQASYVASSRRSTRQTPFDGTCSV